MIDGSGTDVVSILVTKPVLSENVTNGAHRSPEEHERIEAALAEFNTELNTDGLI